MKEECQLQQKERSSSIQSKTITKQKIKKKIVSEKFEKLKEKCRKEEIGSRRGKAKLRV